MILRLLCTVLLLSRAWSAVSASPEHLNEPRGLVGFIKRSKVTLKEYIEDDSDGSLVQTRASFGLTPSKAKQSFVAVAPVKPKRIKPLRPRIRLGRAPALHDGERLTFLGNMLAGALSRSLAQVAVHPLMAAKAMLQTRGAWVGSEAFMKSPDLWFRGAGAQFMTGMPGGAINFAALGAMHVLMARVLPVSTNPVLRDIVAQAVATTFCSVVSSPQSLLVDRISIGMYPDFPTAVRTILSTEGPRGLYVGFKPGLLQRMPSYCLTYATYRALRRGYAHLRGVDVDELSDPENFTLGALGAGIVTAFMMPLDTVKTRIVTFKPGEGEIAYKGMTDCFRRMAREEGLGSFYRALPLRLASVVPMMGIQFGLFEFFNKAIRTHLPARERGRGSKPFFPPVESAQRTQTQRGTPERRRGRFRLGSKKA
uniref:Mitochondrial carrier protein n=1 Tax=Chromera velia CCMP2878 TaxID=1169474 RepID=A0A0G4I4N5_9ALVE|eukprot:Cvel_10941.t1-p1 / transcript=Cvel_10941.t1 / gene=Cvel_10941 / organism=Chromera_velia_CCMP2878 / gene_product=Mitochondrial adenine nucleotide transporter ADNT1, putative / transcript_product=Mitochondrial adenine nucleotide transporter ADNT1, putative / location=Cvel_scaffold672:67526-71045(+) / protein_length=423 / sequence_SO=supercontig / SO=protein_coding / is_pseudo=false